MAGKLNRETYEQLIAEDLAWLMAQPRTLEREHIVAIVKASADHEYGDRATYPALWNGATAGRGLSDAAADADGSAQS